MLLSVHEMSAGYLHNRLDRPDPYRRAWWMIANDTEISSSRTTTTTIRMIGRLIVPVVDVVVTLSDRLSFGTG